jgi:hypothetical protein
MGQLCRPELISTGLGLGLGLLRCEAWPLGPWLLPQRDWGLEPIKRLNQSTPGKPRAGIQKPLKLGC